MAERITIDTPIQFRDALPEAADCVIIGGGVVGVFTALYLAEQGKKVVLCEKGRIAAEQSSRNWGWIRQHGRDEAELPLVIEALDLWQQADNETKGACGFRKTSTNYLASSESELENLQDWLEIAERHGVDTRQISAKEAADLFGDVSNRPWIGGTATFSDAKAEPWQAVPAVAKLAHQKGAILREDCAVRRLETKAGKVGAVITEDGPVACEQVIVAAGAWSSLFLRAHDIHIPQLAVKSTVVQTNQLPQFTLANSADEKLAIRRRDDGSYSLAVCDGHDFYIGPDAFRHLRTYWPVIKDSITKTRMHLAAPKGYPDSWTTKRSWQGDEITPFEQTRVLEPKPNSTFVARILKRYKTRFPKGGEMTVQQSWAGMIDLMPDVVPIIDRVPDLEGLIVATGLSGHGFGIGPGVARAVTNMVLGDEQKHNLHRFRFSRFSDGSPLEIGTAL